MDNPDGNKIPDGSSSRKSLWVTSVISSVAASAIFLVFFQPIIAWLSRSVSELLSRVSVSLLDQLYIQAAMGIERGILGYLSMFTFIIIINVSLFPIVIFLVSKIKSAAGSSKDEFVKKVVRFNTIYGLTSSFIASFSFLYIFVGVVVAVQASTTFDSYVRASSPYLTDAEIKLLHSRWALMETRREYVTIIDDLEDRAQDGGWKLPRRLI